jgi:hypothetical protein
MEKNRTAYVLIKAESGNSWIQWDSLPIELTHSFAGVQILPTVVSLKYKAPL